jgi:transposase InsO family protein
MDIITQEAYFRQRMLKYGEKHSVTETTIKYKISRKTFYKWKKRYDGTVESLKDRPKTPHNSPKGQSVEEIKMVIRAWQHDKGGDKLVMWHNCRKRGYSRVYQTFLRTIRKYGKEAIPRQKRKNKPYESAKYPGQKLQMDVKFVPYECVVDCGKYYQYTAVDEYSRLVYRQMYDEHSTFSSMCFLAECIKFFPFKIKHIQTDNGAEWTKYMAKDKRKKTLFESFAASAGIYLSRIRPYTPRHNGKVERQHRNDQKRFYRSLRMFSLEDGRKQLAAYQKRSMEYPISSLGYKSPLEMLRKYEKKQVIMVA